MRLLLVLLGIGIGLAVTQVGLGWFREYNPDYPKWLPVAAYVGMGVLGGVILLLLSRRLLQHFTQLSSQMQKNFDKMPLNMLMSSVIGLILGLVVAALLRQMLTFLGNSMATTALSAILYLALGALGYNIGKKRSREFAVMVARLSGVREKRKTIRRGYASRKFLDTSAVIDGRIGEILKTGILEGEIVIPQYVINEVQKLADSSDEQTREKGRRGLEMLKQLQEEQCLTVDEADETDIPEVDVKLMRAARDCGGTVITTDTTLQKAAAVSRIRTVNIHALAEALRPALREGMAVDVRLAREGKEAGQAVGHLADGTMVVAENARDRIGQECRIRVTAVRQTSGGRMVFGVLSEA